MCSLVNFVSVSCFVCTGYNKKNSTFASYNWPVAERSANGRPRPVSQKIRESGVKNRPCLSLLESFRILETFEASLDDLADRTLIFCAKRAQSWIFCLLFVSRQKVSRGVRGGSPCSWKNVYLSDYQILLIHILLIYKRIWTCESWIKNCSVFLIKSSIKFRCESWITERSTSTRVFSKSPLLFLSTSCIKNRGFVTYFGHFVAWAEKVLDRNEMNE